MFPFKIIFKDPGSLGLHQKFQTQMNAEAGLMTRLKSACWVGSAGYVPVKRNCQWFIVYFKVRKTEFQLTHIRMLTK